MTTSQLCIEPRTLSRGRLWALLIPILVAQNGLLGLWLLMDSPMVLRMFGVILHGAWLVPLIILPILYRFTVRPFRLLLTEVGRPRHWFAAILLPLLAVGLAGGGMMMAGFETRTDWRWITVALGSVFDMPMMALWMLPVSLVQVLFLTAAITVGRSDQPGGASCLAVGGLAVLANGMLPTAFVLQGQVPMAAGLVLVLFSLGNLAARLRLAGALVPAVIPGVIVFPVIFVAFGIDVQPLSVLLFGTMVTSVEGAFVGSAALQLPASAAVALLLLLLGRLVSITRRAGTKAAGGGPAPKSTVDAAQDQPVE